MTGNSLPGELDLLDLVLRSPRPTYVIINGYPPTTPATPPPDRHKWLIGDGSSWYLYILNELPDDYLHRNLDEGLEITFQTDRPDGLIWFTGNERDNMYLSLKVGCTYSIISLSNEFVLSLSLRLEWYNVS